MTFSSVNRTGPSVQWLTIAGVVADTRRSGVEIPLREELYVPLPQNGAGSTYVVARTSGAPETVIAPVRGAVWSIDPQLPIAQPRTMQTVMASGSLKSVSG